MQRDRAWLQEKAASGVGAGGNRGPPGVAHHPCRRQDLLFPGIQSWRSVQIGLPFLSIFDICAVPAVPSVTREAQSTTGCFLARRETFKQFSSSMSAGLASVLEADLNTYKSKILRILSDCPVQMPEKCSIYATLVGLLNAKNYNFGGEVFLCVLF